jgi:uncharacterized protein
VDGVFVDTAGWAALFLRTEPQHAAAAALFQTWRRQERLLVTTNYVLAELVALLTRPLRVPREIQLRYADGIRAARYVEVVYIDSASDAAGWDLLRSRSDKEWSLVDAVSFVVMREHGITEALTTDQHFVQAGSVRLLTP